MKSWIYDKKTRELIAALSINVVSILFFVLWSQKYFNNMALIDSVLILTGVFFILCGDFDIIRNSECLEEGFLLARFRYTVFFLLVISTIQSPMEMMLFQALNLIVWCLLLFVSIQIVFSGYYFPIRSWIAPTIFALVILMDLFAFINGLHKTYWILYELLELSPLVMFIYLCVRNYKQSFKLRCRIEYVIYIIILLCKIIFGIILVYLEATKITLLFLCVYNVANMIILVLITSMFSTILGRRNKEYYRSTKYNLLFWGSAIILCLIIFSWARDVIPVVIFALASMTLVIMYEIAESLYHESDSFLKHNNAVMQYEYELRQNHKVTDFLHDDVLQDLYAAKLMVADIDDSSAVSGVSKILDTLQYRIRSEIENYGINIEKSMSFKENIDEMLLEIIKRYSESSMEIYFKCNDDMIVPKPYDGILYISTKELINNALKHSRGDRCDISLDIHANRLRLMVENDGEVINLNEKQLLEKGFGLASMKSKITAIGGTFNLDIKVTGGLYVTIEI